MTVSLSEQSLLEGKCSVPLGLIQGLLFCKKQLFSFPENVIITLYRRMRFFRCARMYGTNRNPLHKTDEKE